MLPPQPPTPSSGLTPESSGPQQPAATQGDFTPFASPALTPPPPTLAEGSFQVGATSSPPTKRRRGLAIGIVAGALVVACAAIVLVATLVTNRSTRPAVVTEAVRISVKDLRPGDCVDPMPQGPGIEKVTVVECSQFHAAQVIDSVELKAGAGTQEAIDRAASEQCTAVTADSLERAAAKKADTGPVMSYLAPSDQSWAKGDRRVDCLVYVPGPGISGSLLP